MVINAWTSDSMSVNMCVDIKVVFACRILPSVQSPCRFCLPVDPWGSAGSVGGLPPNLHQGYSLSTLTLHPGCPLETQGQSTPVSILLFWYMTVVKLAVRIHKKFPLYCSLCVAGFFSTPSPHAISDNLHLAVVISFFHPTPCIWCILHNDSPTLLKDSY